MSSPSSRAPRAFLCARHNSSAPTTKGRIRLDKNLYLRVTNALPSEIAKVANKFNNGTLWKSLGILKFP